MPAKYTERHAAGPGTIAMCYHPPRERGLMSQEAEDEVGSSPSWWAKRYCTTNLRVGSVHLDGDPENHKVFESS